MSDHDQPNELIDSPAFLTMPEENWAREEASYTAEVYAAPAEDEGGGESPAAAAAAVSRARALLEEAGNLSQWRHLPDQVHVRTREAVWALCVAVEALERQGVTLHEPAPDLDRPRDHLDGTDRAGENAALNETIADLRQQLAQKSDDYHNLSLIHCAYRDENAELKEERDQLREARDVFRTELHAALAERNQAREQLERVREALTVPNASPLTLFDYQYSRYAFGEDASFERECFITEFVTGDTALTDQMRALRAQAQQEAA